MTSRMPLITCYAKLNFHFFDLRSLLPPRDTYLIINIKYGDPRECVISEMLCYFQGTINNVEHDVIMKAVITYYNESDIGIAKKLLFDKCCDTKIRYKTYYNDKAEHDCQDIINKMNEVGEDSPMFVAVEVNNLPLALYT